MMWLRVPFVAACAISGALVGGCAPAPTGAPAHPPPTLARPDPATPAPASLARDPTLVLSASGVAFVNDATPIAPIGADPTQGFDASLKRNGKNDLYVLPLAAAIQRAQATGRVTHTLAIHVDPDIPYRTLFEVLYTAGQTEISRYDLTETAATKRTVSFAPPTMAVPMKSGEGQPPRALHFVGLIVKDGVSLKTAFGNVRPGCDETGPGIAFPRLLNGGIDTLGIRDCIERIRARNPDLADETNFTVAANPGVPFHEIMDVIDAAREGSDGKPLLPDIQFGVGR